MSDKYEYEIKTIDPAVMDQINQRLEEGRALVAKGFKGSVAGAHFAWIDSFSSLINIIDPLGDSYSHSLVSAWQDAHWMHGDAPKNSYDYEIIFGQCLAVVESLRVGRVKVVKLKRPSAAPSVGSRCVFHRRSLPVQENLVFVLMPYTESWSDYIWKEEIKPAVEGIKELSLICARADDLLGQDVVVDIYESILKARVIIAEVTGRNANVFYELGIAHTLGKEVILLTQGSQHIPFDLTRFRHCIYSNDGPGYKVLKSYLPKAIARIIKGDN
jgi:hypothetical protein